MKTIATLAAATLLALPAFSGTAAAERITFKSAKTGTSYYQMSVQVAEAIGEATDGDVTVTVEESQGSVQNVLGAAVRQGNYVFTTPPSLIDAARAGAGPFKDKTSPRFEEIRALFPLPSLTMHFVARDDAGIDDFADLAGKTILLGKGSFGAREGEKYLGLFGLADKVEIADVELSSAVPALKNGQIDAFVTAGSWPAPNVMEAAAGTGVDILSLSDAQIEKTGRTRIEIPAGTYAGQDEPIITTSLPVIAYATAAMSDETAYEVTKAFWDRKDEMAEISAWWKGVTPEMLANITTELHPGAIRYYEERGIDPDGGTE